MNEYEEKKQARIEKYKEHAANALEAVSKRYEITDQITENIPLGQPIARSIQSKISNNMEKAAEEQKKAEYYEAKVEAAENNTAISADDPNAVKKLREKLEKLKEEQKYKKRVNSYYRKNKTCKGCEGVSDKFAALLDQEMCAAYSWDKAPYGSVTLQNLNANIKRIEKRIELLEKQKENPPESWEFEGGYVEMDLTENRVQIFFDTIPKKEYRIFLHQNLRFNWSKRNGAWQRQITEAAIRAAHTAVERYTSNQESI